MLHIPLSGITQKSYAEKLRKQIEKTIEFETTIDYELTPGFIIGIVDGINSIVLSFGTRGIMSEDTISDGDIFEIGSVTKVFTASLIAEMVTAGEISLNTHFDTLLPKIYRNQEMTQFTVEDLLTHQTGLPRYPPFNSGLANPLRSIPSFTLDDLLGLYKTFHPNPENRITYSNVGYALIEPVLYNSTQLEYPALLSKYLLNKTGMMATTLVTQEVTAPGYNLNVEMVPPVDFAVFNSSGGLKSNMADMLKFVRYSLYNSPEMLWRQYGPGLGKHLDMGLGWHIIHQGRFFQIYMHTGRSNGHTAFVGLVPETKTGVVILANSATGVDDLGMEILRMINKNWKRKN